jgi:hypothetical protein
MELQPLPVGIQTFRKIIEGGYLYVDKTRYLYELIRHPSGTYFISRPRRFGKSLLISTLDEIFQGNRELFKGLWLYDSPYAWTEHPVIRVDFGQRRVYSAQELEQYLTEHLYHLAQKAELVYHSQNYQGQFVELIRHLGAQNQVVILVDEYDKPMLDNINDLAEAQHIREILKGFYGVIKSLDAHIRFVLLTGVSKFSRVGVFSGLNNLNDLTMDNQYAAMLGITQTELENRFQPYLKAFVEEQGLSLTDLQAKIRTWYNGFCFSRQRAPVYNPFSLLLLFQKREFQNYWFESGTPTFLLKLLKARNYPLQDLEQLEIPDLAFSTYELESLEIIPLLFQTGYLTIKAYEDRFQTYTLAYPNYEVRRAFMTYLLSTYSEVELAFAGSALKQLTVTLLKADWRRFFQALNTLLASINYELHIKQEKYYQTIFYLIFKLIGLEINAEVHTNQGRIDAVIETDTAVYLFEFKLEGSATEALQQIRTKEYFTRYQLTGKTLHLLGVHFDIDTRSVTEWLPDL